MNKSKQSRDKKKRGGRVDIMRVLSVCVFGFGFDRESGSHKWDMKNEDVLFFCSQLSTC